MCKAKWLFLKTGIVFCVNGCFKNVSFFINVLHDDPLYSMCLISVYSDYIIYKVEIWKKCVWYFFKTNLYLKLWWKYWKLTMYRNV